MDDAEQRPLFGDKENGADEDCDKTAYGLAVKHSGVRIALALLNARDALCNSFREGGYLEHHPLLD